MAGSRHSSAVSEEVASTVAELNDNKKSKPAKVLRATDVIPPFDNETSQQPPAPPEIPTFDLAEHILAEHRRTASRHRKAPGQAQAQPEARQEPVAVKTHVIEPPSEPSQDLPELHRVVAEIVARDIERLCKQPARPPQE
jgi:cell pole-organizing protein PopZ